MILAGGESTRFGGAAKGLATVGAERIIDRVAGALRSACDDLLLVANDIEARSWLAGVRVVGDVRPHLGPLGGLHAALAHARGAIVVVAWDMPFVPDELVRRLRAEGERMGSDSGGLPPDAVVPRHGDGIVEPLCAFYALSCLAPIERALDRGERQCGAFHGEVRVRWLNEEEWPAGRDGMPAFTSINSAGELSRMRALVAGAGPLGAPAPERS